MHGRAFSTDPPPPPSPTRGEGGAARSLTAILLRAAGLWATLALVGCGQAPAPPTAEPLSAEDFRRELVNLPLCGTPQTGPLAGKAMCTVHFADGTAVLAGSGMVARIAWEADGRSICRRDISEAAGARLCVTYERLSNGRFRNSDGVEFCLGPCPLPPR